MDLRIQCINKSDRMNAHERIVRIGGLDQDGARWTLQLADAISGVEHGKWRFWIGTGNSSAAPMNLVLPALKTRRHAAKPATTATEPAITAWLWPPP